MKYWEIFEEEGLFKNLPSTCDVLEVGNKKQAACESPHTQLYPHIMFV